MIEKVKNGITELVFILDRSGSMSGLESDTIGGFNAMIEKQKKQDGECYVSTVLFDNVSEVLHDRVRLTEIKPMTDREYTVRGCTALIDALGGAIHHIGNIHIGMHAGRMYPSTPFSSLQQTEWKTQVTNTQVMRSRR